MSALNWLLAGLITLLLLCALAALVNKSVDALLTDVESALQCRTANWSQIERDTARLQRQVLRAPLSVVPTARPIARPNDAFKQMVDAARAAGIKAADLEFDQGVITLNPYPQPSRWHVLWTTTREARLIERELATAAAHAVHTDARQEA